MCPSARMHIRLRIVCACRMRLSSTWALWTLDCVRVDSSLMACGSAPLDVLQALLYLKGVQQANVPYMETAACVPSPLHAPNVLPLPCCPCSCPTMSGAASSSRAARRILSSTAADIAASAATSPFRPTSRVRPGCPRPHVASVQHALTSVLWSYLLCPIPAFFDAIKIDGRVERLVPDTTTNVGAACDRPSARDRATARAAVVPQPV